jgi:hypothetical protein
VRYDALHSPDAETWLGHDESARLDAVLRYHERIKARAEKPRLHAAIHAVVENQIAEGLESTRSALDRLQQEGLDRHEAIHAIGSVLADYMVSALRGQAFDAEAYDRALGGLTAASRCRTEDED